MSAKLFTQFALPDDLYLDVFVSGDEEVDGWFRSRKWFNATKGKASPPTYVFRTAQDGDVVGCASVAFRKMEHPEDASSQRAKYLMVYVVGVNIGFHGQRNPQAPDETFAASIFGVIEALAMKHSDCVGLSLWVRSTNARAIAFYQKVGFVADPSGAVQRDDKAPHLTMRRLFGTR